MFAVDGPVGAIVERLHALHHPGLVAELPAGLTAWSPLFHHPPVSTAGSLKRFPCHIETEFFLLHKSRVLTFVLKWHKLCQDAHMEAIISIYNNLLTTEI